MRHGRLIGRLVLAGMLLAGLWLGSAAHAVDSAAAPTDENIILRSMVLGETSIAPGATQLLQVTVANTNRHAVTIGLRADLRDKHDRRVGSPMMRRVNLPAKDEERYLFKFRAPESVGDYAVRFEVFTGDFKHAIIPGAPVFYSPFAVGEGRPAPRPAAAQEARATAPNFLPPSGLKFERPDLLWENVTVPKSVLLGEPLHIKADLRNVGGDLARNIQVSLVYFNTSTPGNTERISDSTVHILAPGERLEMEFDVNFPDDALLGEYQVRLSIDPADTIDELNKANNVVTTAPFRLTRIKLVFPEPNYAFEEQGLFLFRWDSLRYDQFKVQVGTSPNFSNPGDYFDLPQGEKWTQEKEIVPLEGELPSMAQGLLEKTGAHRLYWRVQARNSKTGRTDFSAVQPFTIKPSPKPKETTAPAAMESAPAEPQGQPEQPAQPEMTPQSGAPAQPGATPQSGEMAQPSGAVETGSTAEPSSTAQPAEPAPPGDAAQPAEPAPPAGSGPSGDMPQPGGGTQPQGAAPSGAAPQG
ncbi:MAG TPA: CARDB domain-containing protein [bacterium]|nr:CARDB domain-containing protein [bacterium]